jgi:hypothetical protein
MVRISLDEAYHCIIVNLVSPRVSHKGSSGIYLDTTSKRSLGQGELLDKAA